MNENVTSARPSKYPLGTGGVRVSMVSRGRFVRSTVPPICFAAAALSISFHVGYASLTLHVASGAAAAALATVAATVAVRRIGVNDRPLTVLLAAATATTAIGIWAFELIPVLVGGERLEQRLAWGHATTSLYAAAALLVTAASPALRLGPRTARRIALATLGAAVATSALVVAIVPAHVQLGRVRHTIAASATPGILPAQAICAVLFAAAAALFVVRGRREGSAFLIRLGLTAALFACSRIVFFQIPSLYTAWVSPGDAWRLLAYATLTVALVAQLRREWADEVAREERARLARQIHSGVAQDLAALLLVLGQSGDSEQDSQELDAARKAFSASRAMIDELAG
jgi:signal transduction histidine kinase